MATRNKLFVWVAAGLLLAATGVGPGQQPAQATSPSESPVAAGGTTPYTGNLTDEAGRPVADGAYSFTFELYAAQTGGGPLWMETQPGVPVRGGSFAAVLGMANRVPAGLLTGVERWLAVDVRGPGDDAFTTLTPRQLLAPTSASAGVSPAAGAACPHDHLGDTWAWGANTANGLVLTGAVPWVNGLLRASNSNNGPSVWGVNTGGGNAVRGDGYGASIGVYGEGASGPGVAGNSETGDGVQGGAAATGKSGVYGHTSSDAGGYGVYGNADTTTGYGWGVAGFAHALNAIAGYFTNDGGGNALWASSAGSGADKATLRVHNNNSGSGMAEYLTNLSGFATSHMQNTGSGEVLVLQSSGGSFLRAVTESWAGRFRLDYGGTGHAQTGWSTPYADFAEMLPAAQESSLEPGDVLAIGPDGKLVRASEAYQATVAGVYSANPGFVGGQPMEGGSAGSIPLAVVGVVPVKVSAENGAIRPGDLLVASATPGHAMKGGANPPLGTVIGKALDKLDLGVGVIKMLATLQ